MTVVQLFDRSISPKWWREEKNTKDHDPIKYQYILGSEGNDDTPMLMTVKGVGSLLNNNRF
jgi:hypothetical protein